MTVKERTWKTQEVLAVAYAAYKKNKGYLKDTFRFSEPTNDTVFANKDLVKFQLINDFRPEDWKPLVITEQDYADVDDALKHFRRYTLGILGDSLSQFQQDTIEAILSDDVASNKLGILAYVPELVIRETKENSFKKTLRTVYRNSNYIGEVGDPVDGVCHVINESFIQDYDKFVYTADIMGNIISFWTKYKIPSGERRRIKAKVKKHVKNKLFDVNETQLNYVKVYKV
tara:strand:+ start:95 stop:781 length:687 start_codon:yes stop_codon:yes gene_type:complete